MRALIWTQYFWPENFRISDLVTALHNQGIEVTVLTGKPNYPDGKIFKGYKMLGIQQENFSGAKIIRIPLIPRGSSSAKMLILNYLSFIFSGYFLAPWALKGQKFDIVFVYGLSPLLQALPAIFTARRKRAPLILWVQDLWPESLQATGFIRNKWFLKLVRAVMRYIYKRTDSVLIQSEGFRNPIENIYKNNNKITFFPNFAEDYLPVPYKCEIAKEIEKSFSIVFTGNIGTAQSCDTIIAAAELLQNQPEIKFYLIGSGSRLDSIKLEVTQKNLSNVVIPGQLPPSDMASIFAAASVLLVSLADSPALAVTIPSKLQSYLSAGKPIIASLNGEAARLVTESKAGLCCPAENPEALASTILQLHQMSLSERIILGKNGRQYFKDHFDISEQVTKLITHMEKVSTTLSKSHIN